MTKEKKTKTVEDVVEEVKEEGIEVEVVTKEEFKTITDNDGYTWKVDSKTGKWLERI
jgi:tRNA G18 (ribose-2'-O)-methylase SpoU